MKLLSVKAIQACFTDEPGIYVVEINVTAISTISPMWDQPTPGQRRTFYTVRFGGIDNVIVNEEDYLHIRAALKPEVDFSEGIGALSAHRDRVAEMMGVEWDAGSSSWKPLDGALR